MNGGHTGGTAAHSLARSNKDYQRSPGKIFHPSLGNQVSTNFNGTLSTKATANAMLNALSTPLQLSNHNRE